MDVCQQSQFVEHPPNLGLDMSYPHATTMKRDLDDAYDGTSLDQSLTSPSTKRQCRIGSQVSEPIPYQLLANIANERRRVNPESLALKLGPNLVRELDALIPPGSTDMPCFALRKVIQERHNLDRYVDFPDVRHIMDVTKFRRHIYDYYHSKGLRVVKEDKNTNLARARAQPISNTKVFRVDRQSYTLA
jgi:hypothetical protein